MRCAFSARRDNCPGAPSRVHNAMPSKCPAGSSTGRGTDRDDVGTRFAEAPREGSENSSAHRPDRTEKGRAESEGERTPGSRGCRAKEPCCLSETPQISRKRKSGWREDPIASLLAAESITAAFPRCASVARPAASGILMLSGRVRVGG
ncbi:hypothetical protein C8T65DRAFT_671122 [Cerioporus squamosus]|nr:hypothetical protein C8T65DRAFT_671122 [Cerioporus squamosus]